jgi:hypothetical protein
MPPLQKNIAQEMPPLLKDIIPAIPPLLPSPQEDRYKPKFNNRYIGSRSKFIFGSIKP